MEELDPIDVVENLGQKSVRYVSKYLSWITGLLLVSVTLLFSSAVMSPAIDSAGSSLAAQGQALVPILNVLNLVGGFLATARVVSLLVSVLSFLLLVSYWFRRLFWRLFGVPSKDDVRERIIQLMTARGFISEYRGGFDPGRMKVKANAKRKFVMIEFRGSIGVDYRTLADAIAEENLWNATGVEAERIGGAKGGWRIIISFGDDAR